MHSEFYRLTEEAAATLNEVRKTVDVLLQQVRQVLELLKLLVPNIMVKLKRIAVGQISLSNQVMNGK